MASCEKDMLGNETSLTPFYISFSKDDKYVESVKFLMNVVINIDCEIFNEDSENRI